TAAPAASPTATAAPTAAQAPATAPAAGQTPAGAAAPQPGEAIGPGQTVTGTLIGSEAAMWSVAGGHGPLDLVLDVGPFGDALMIVEDGAGARRDYVDAQSGPEERLVGLEIPAGETYRVTVRNSSNAQVDYSLAVSATPPPRPVALGETVAGELYYNEGATWLFEGGPATIDVTVELGPGGDALLLVFDPGGVRREYVDAQTGPQERLLGYEIPSAGAYRLVVRNTHNTPTSYTLAVGP
ncbi:MAG TPA: hypothetical protein PKD53_23270, partial [Chloroflexaceae bacterium]|nr:hypothetical protein [Chloroflexaceae bacterium]